MEETKTFGSVLLRVVFSGAFNAAGATCSATFAVVLGVSRRGLSDGAACSCGSGVGAGAGVGVGTGAGVASTGGGVGVGLRLTAGGGVGGVMLCSSGVGRGRGVGSGVGSGVAAASGVGVGVGVGDGEGDGEGDGVAATNESSVGASGGGATLPKRFWARLDAPCSKSRLAKREAAMPMPRRVPELSGLVRGDAGFPLGTAGGISYFCDIFTVLFYFLGSTQSPGTEPARKVFTAAGREAQPLCLLCCLAHRRPECSAGRQRQFCLY